MQVSNAMSCKLRAVLAIRLHPRDMGLRSKAGTVCISPKSITQSDCSRGCRVFIAVCPSVFFSHGISKTDAARITKFDTQMLHDESWKLIYFGIKRSPVTKTVPAWGFALLWVLASSSTTKRLWPPVAVVVVDDDDADPAEVRAHRHSVVSSTVSSRRSVISAARNQVIFGRRPVQAGTGATRDRSILPGRRRHVCRPTGARVWTVSATNRRPGATHTIGLLT